MKQCRDCTLNDTIFSVRVGEDGLCNYCRQRQARGDAMSVAPEEAERQLRDAFDAHSDRPYQVLLAYSGGKDSTYTLYKLRREFKVSVLAVTFDNGFLTDQCRRNIHTVTAELDVDSMTVKPSFSKLARGYSIWRRRGRYSPGRLSNGPAPSVPPALASSKRRPTGKRSCAVSRLSASAGRRGRLR